MFFRLDSSELALIILAIVGGATVAGFVGGRYLREHSASLREPFGVLQAALLGGTSWRDLASAGLVGVHDPVALSAADELFAVPQAPYAGFIF